MSNLLEQTDYFVKSKRYEKKSGKMPNKIKFTAATHISLKKNIDYNFIEKAIEKLNTIYSELISAVEIAEKVKAEEEARSKISGNRELESKIEEDEKVSKMTDAAIVNKRMKRVTIELLKLAGRIGTYKDNYGINAKKGFTTKSPKAISVPKLYSEVYKSLMNKIDLYKMAEKKGLEVSENGEVVTKDEDVPSWRKLFDNMNNIPSEVNVAMNKSNDDEETVEYVQPSSNKVTEEDISYRKMLAQLGEEFELIENYKKNANGVPSQFKDGFESREQNLSSIFQKLTGITIKRKNIDELALKDNTEFQNLIDQVNGYKDPLTEKEHKEMEDSMNEYYSREDVSSKISELKEKDVLYTFNQHMGDVIQAEIKDNNKDAVATVTASNEETAVNEAELAKERELAELKAGAEEQARMLKTLYDYIDKRDKFEEEKAAREEAEKQALVDGAVEQAKMLNERNMAIDAAHEVAQNIVNEQVAEIRQAKMNEMIATSADEEARRIINDQKVAEQQEEMHQMIVASANEEARRLNDNNMVIAGAEEQAKIIFNKEQQAERQEILASAEEEARRINDNNMVIAGAEEQAKIIFNKEQQAERQEILASAEEEARRINDRNMIVVGAEDQAKIIFDKEQQAERQEILEGAESEAHRLFDLSLIADGAVEQAKQLQQNNEYIDICESADAEARILLSKDKKNSLLEEARELSERLKNITEEADKIDLSIAKIAEEDAMDNSSILPKEVDEEIIASGEEAQKIQSRNELLDSADQEARRLHENNLMLDSADQEARRLHENNLTLDSADQEARRLHENNIILESAEEEARKIIASETEPVVQSVTEPVVQVESQESPIVAQVTPVVPVVNQETPIVTQVAPVISQENPTATPIVPMVGQTKGDNYLQLLDSNDRYGELTKKSNALLVKQARIINISSRVNNGSQSTIDKRKAVLNTLKEELETGNYSFLQRSENMEEMVPTTKAA